MKAEEICVICHMEVEHEETGRINITNLSDRDSVERHMRQMELEEICVKCHMEFEHEETVGTLGCTHKYHTSYIKQWLLRKKDCPMCGASVLPLYQRR
ncbi:hypothetical protein H5410_052086 [Solanum commersonii]|uniref:RING-type E3 ubiquitin transferase n=1 Tax=Solanum commersonii TaxID=4109 RepID=A0A9J5X073_SOLCO|nr:hypothetical protein H5410_052086 [Solanum commersonii]